MKASLPIARNPRIARIRASFGQGQRTDLPIPADETRECVAYVDRQPIGRFAVVADDCLTQDTIRWRGHFWNLQMMAECGSAMFPQANLFGFDDPRPLSAIR